MKTPHKRTVAMAKKLGTELLTRKMTLSVAESCTGGMIGSALTYVAGSSAWFMGGIIAYDNRVKERILKVPKSVLVKHGAVSRECALAMVSGVNSIMKTDCAIAVTGIAGPGGGTREKPVGLVYIGIKTGDETGCCELHLEGGRQSIREQTVREGIRLLAVRLDRK